MGGSKVVNPDWALTTLVLARLGGKGKGEEYEE